MGVIEDRVPVPVALGEPPNQKRLRCEVIPAMQIPYNGTAPTIGKDVYVAPTAVLIGDVTVGDGASIWFNAVLRGDIAPIVIGRNSNVQDNCTIHCDVGKPVTVGDNVTIGHNAVIHGCTIGDGCLIGIGAILLNDVHILPGTVVAAGALVREGSRMGPRQLVTGTPAVAKKALSDKIIERSSEAAGIYRGLAEVYRKAAN
jgi:carbonic anhydrase/acetyltransferase-like protein (isoleucine patch superfamily)